MRVRRYHVMHAPGDQSCGRSQTWSTAILFHFRRRMCVAIDVWLWPMACFFLFQTPVHQRQILPHILLFLQQSSRHRGRTRRAHSYQLGDTGENNSVLAI